MQFQIKCLIFFVLFISSIADSSAAKVSGTGTYKFGVFPYLSAVLLDDIYSPVSNELTAVLGKKIYFRTSSTFQRFFKKLEQQQYDFALIQPFWYPPAVDKFGYKPLVRMKEPFTSLIMVLDKSSIADVADLKGKIIATPPAFVPVVHMAKRALQEKNLKIGEDVQLKAFKTVDSCFHQVVIGAADACVAPPFAPAVIEEKMRVRLRVLLETSSIPNLSLVVHSRVPEQDRELIKQTFMSWNNTQTGQKLLTGMKTQQFVPAVDSEYDVVRSLLTEINN